MVQEANLASGRSRELCVRCVQPIPPLATVCPGCGEPHARTTVLPYESIGTEWTFYGRVLQLLPVRARKSIAALVWSALAGYVFLLVLRLGELWRAAP